MTALESVPKESTDSAGPSGLERALQIVYAVTDAGPNGIGVSALARALGLPKAVVHRILKILSGDGFLAFDESTKRYRLGHGALSVGLAAISNLDVRSTARARLHQLVEETAETATLSMRQGWSRVYVDQVPSPQEIRMTVTLGQPYPLHAGSSSKAILATLANEEIEEYLLHRSLDVVTDHTVVDPAALRLEVAEIRSIGYAVSVSERQEGAGSVAAAIRQADGQVFGSISLCGPSGRFDQAVQHRYGQLVAAAAEAISTAIGYRRRSPDGVRH